MMFFSTYIKLFFVLTPFMVLSSFLTWAGSTDSGNRHRLIFRFLIAVVLISMLLLVVGKHLFAAFGITLDSFRVGAGLLLLLSAIGLVQGKAFYELSDGQSDFTIVPLAIPITVGPGTTGVLMVMGTEMVTWQQRLVGISSLLCAILTLGMLLYMGTFLEKHLGQLGLNVLSKLTGLVLAAFSVQIMMQGISNQLLN
ncbi:MAG: hypothetical protein CMJ19_10140 [Phycisphaeraceae bacterium]|nr:hypothetical protein [Phycisphaeraceae bacterium]